MPSPTLARAAVAGLLLALGAGAPALAQTWLQATAVVDAKHFAVGVDDPWTDSDYVSREGSVPFGRLGALADSDHQAQVYNGLGIAWAEVGLGGVHVYAQAQSVAGGPDMLRVTGSGQASGFMSDFFSLNVPGVAAGASFTVTAQVRVDASAHAETLPAWVAPPYPPVGQLAAFSHWESWVRVLRGDTGSTLAELRANEDCDARTNTGSGPFCTTGGLPGLQTISFTVATGTPVQLDMRGWASAGTSIYQPMQLSTADGQADLGHTIAWGGITTLRDASGATVTDYTAVSASSGFDYRNAYVGLVPEAPSSLLLLAGLAMLGTGWRRGLHRAG